MNFLALLGWAPDGETTIMSRDELVERFSLERVGSSPATFDYAKLDWMNGVYLRALPADEYADRLVAYLREQGSEWPEERIRAAAPLVQEKIGSFGEFAGFAGFLFHDVEPDPDLLDERILDAAASALEKLESWTAGEIEVVAEAALRRAGGEAAHRLPPDPRRRHRVARVAGPLREPGAPGERPACSNGSAASVSALADLVGVELGPTSWIDVPQERIDQFAEATGRPAVDPRRSGTSRRRSVRDDHRARLPHARALRAHALRAASTR